MSQERPYDPKPQFDQGPRKRSVGKWLLLGCGGFGLVIFLVCIGAGIWGFRWVSRQMTQFTQEFTTQGYVQQTGQVIEVSQSPKEKTVYASQVLKINKDVDVDIAAVSQVMEVNADIHGDVDFLGQVLKVNPGKVIHGDLRIKNAQAVHIDGEVRGKISGNYMVLLYQGKPVRPGDLPGASPAGTGESDERPPSSTNSSEDSQKLEKETPHDSPRPLSPGDSDATPSSPEASSSKSDSR